MATSLKNLSEYDPNKLPSKEHIANQKYAIVVADWNTEVTSALLDGAVEAFLQSGVLEEHLYIMRVPGTFELTYASHLLQEEDKYAGIVAIGCVIRGDTPHFDYICQGVSIGLSHLNANGMTPVIFSVLTTENQQQALDRAGGKHGNKGTEGAITAIRMANL